MPHESTHSDRFVKNSLTGLLRYIITVPLLLVVTPYILRQLGNEGYGVWAIFGVVTAFADLSDLGIYTSLARFVAQYRAVGDKQAIDRSVSTVLVIYLVTGGAVSSLILIGGHFLAVDVFRITGSFADDAIFVITGAAIAFFISLLSGTFGAVMMGLQRMDLWNVRLLTYTILDSVGAVAVLAFGYGLHGLVINRIIVCLVIGLVNYWTAYRIMPNLKLRLSNFSLKCGGEIVGYSMNILVSKMATMAREPFSKTILLRFATLSGVTYFDLGARIAHQARGVFSAMLGPLLPASSEIQTLRGTQAIRDLYYSSLRYIVLAVLPVFGGLIVLAKPIIDVWLGPQYWQVVATLQVLLIANFFAVQSSPAFTIMEGIGLARVSATSSMASALLNVVLSIGLGIRWGYSGVLAGYCISIIIGSVVTQTLFQQRLAIPFVETLKRLPHRAMFVDVFSMVGTWLLVTYSGLHGISALIISTSVYLAMVIFGITACRCLNKADFIVIKRLLVIFPK